MREGKGTRAEVRVVTYGQGVDDTPSSSGEYVYVVHVGRRSRGPAFTRYQNENGITVIVIAAISACERVNVNLDYYHHHVDTLWLRDHS